MFVVSIGSRITVPMGTEVTKTSFGRETFSTPGVGLATGLAVGLAVGVRVGAGVGLAVGFTVGTGVGPVMVMSPLF